MNYRYFTEKYFNFYPKLYQIYTQNLMKVTIPKKILKCIFFCIFLKLYIIGILVNIRRNLNYTNFTEKYCNIYTRHIHQKKHTSLFFCILWVFNWYILDIFMNTWHNMNYTYFIEKYSKVLSTSILDMYTKYTNHCHS